MGIDFIFFLIWLLIQIGLLASNGIMGTMRVNDSAVFLVGVASTNEKLLKSLSNYRTKVKKSTYFM
jgi:hypothetical protein